jgi:alkylation response protein AidB-like acyl-CoA dehydrogenase
MKDWNAMSDGDFRLKIRTFFETSYPAELRYPPRRLRWHESRDWYAKLVEHGCVAPNWPSEHGGMGLSPAKLLIFIEEQERWGVSRTPDMGIVMVGPLLIRYGTEEQRRRFLPSILSGEHIWCQGYSEPNAGSDLASLTTQARIEDDEFVVNGHKIWTTLAHDATHMFALVRTDPAAKKQEGISFLLIDMRQEGVTVRPITNILGHDEFCEVFLDDVRAPFDNLVGTINAGWTMAKALLGFERIFLGSPKLAEYALNRLEELAAGCNWAHDAAFLSRFTQLRMDVADLGSLYQRFADKLVRGEPLGPDVSLLKIWNTETFQRITELMIETAAERGILAGNTRYGDKEIDVLSLYYNAMPATIYGGSSEIQRNIISRNVLGLPAS